jgi:hypothetical protein
MITTFRGRPVHFLTNNVTVRFATNKVNVLLYNFVVT